MTKLLLTYTVLDEEYENGKFRFFQGKDGKPQDVELPKDTGLAGIIGPMDSDPVAHSYMGGANLDEPRALVSVIDNGARELAKYSVGIPAIPAEPGAPITWTAGGVQGLKFVGADKTPLIGDPYGVAQAGKYLYFVDYGTTDIYRIDLAAFESSGAPNYDLAANTYTVFPDDIRDAKIFSLPSSGGYSARGASLIALTDSRAAPVVYLYAAYNILSAATPSQPTVYDKGVIVRFKVDGATGALTEGTCVAAGKNIQGLIPVYGGPDGIALLVPCIGGPQNFGSTNGAASTLCRVPAFDSFTDNNSIAAFTGDTSDALALAGSCDIKSAAASDDGLVYLLTETEDDTFNTWWKLYRTTAAAVLGSSGMTITDALNNNILEQLDSGVGSKGFEWQLMYENATPASQGRLWFVKGTPIQVSQGNDYNTKLLFDTGALYPPNSSDPLYTISYKNVNSADLIGEMIYQHGKGHSIDTRLVKGGSGRYARGNR